MKDNNIIERKVVNGELFEVCFNGSGLGCTSCCFKEGEGCSRPDTFENCTCVNRKDNTNVYFKRLRDTGIRSRRKESFATEMLTNGKVIVSSYPAPTIQKMVAGEAEAALYIYEKIDKMLMQRLVNAVSLGSAVVSVTIDIREVVEKEGGEE